MTKYKYDACGNIKYQTGSMANINPYRYRGYRYDDDTGLYYLNSRYYNPVIGRFISADGLVGSQGDILGHNMYAYTQNNPVMYTDYSGFAPQWLKTMGTVAAAIAVVCLVTAAVTLTAGAAAYVILGAAAQTGIATVMIGAASGD